MRLTLPVLAFVLAGLGAPLVAQSPASVTAAAVVDGYSFDPGLGFESVTEFSLPVVGRMGLGDRANLVVSTGWASLTSKQADGEEVTLSGVLDTEARLTLSMVPNRFSLLATAVLPSGTSSLETEQLPVLAVIANEALDLSTVRFGSGGAVGGGVVGALPVGVMALGVAATVRQDFAYDPVASSPTEFQPGAEAKLRVGLEGPVARTAYLRFAGIVSYRGEDELGGTEQGSSSTLWTGYAALENGFGTSDLVVYLFDNFRTAPRLEGTAFGPTVLPRSNTFAAGARWSFPVRGLDRVTPLLEYRLTQAAPSPTVDELEELGTSLRAGVEYRLRAAPRASLVLKAQGVWGEVGDLRGSPLVGVSGYRAGVHLELTR